MTGRLRNIKSASEAVSDSDGAATLNLQPIGGRHSIEVSSTRGMTVRTVKLDSIVNEKVDLVKVNVEGAEWRVIRGAGASIRAGKILKWIIEMHDERIGTELENYLKTMNYTTQWLDDRHLFAYLL